MAAEPDPGERVDETVKPGDDFYRFANGPWLKSATIPDGQKKYDSSTILQAKNAARVRELVERAANSAPEGDATERALRQKIGDYFASWMDRVGIEAKGISPLKDELAAIDAIHDREGLSAYLGRTLRLDDGSDTQPDNVFGVWIHQGFHDPDRYVPHIVQGGLGLSDSDAYAGSTPEKDKQRSDYRARIAAVFKQAGFTDPDVRAGYVIDLETAMAKTQMPAADLTDIFKVDHSWERADFDGKAPGLDWAAFFKSAGLNERKHFVVWQPASVTGTSALAASAPIAAWKDYLTFHLIAHYASVLPKAFGGDGAGDEQAAIAACNAALGEAIGRLYVKRYFPPQAKAAAIAMVENIRTAYRAHIAKLSWMSPQTKQKALVKLAALHIGIGYPDKWIDYASLTVVHGDALGNLRRSEAFDYQQSLAKLDEPVDPSEWPILPQSVGGVIIFSPNTEVFAAGIFQPPYFDPEGDAASNYGSAGAGLSHEVGHSFDELGNIYDDRGRLGLWWSADELAHYRAAAAPVAAQFDAYCPQEGLCVHGKQVLSESVADIAGLKVALDAYHLSLHGALDVVKDGLTGGQRFFLAFARRWRRLQTDAALHQLIATDIHPPGEYRADTVRNVDAWYRAFGVKPGDKLYLKPEQRAHIW